MENLPKKRGTKYLGSQIWESQMPVFFFPRCAISPSEATEPTKNQLSPHMNKRDRTTVEEALPVAKKLKKPKKSKTKKEKKDKKKKNKKLKKDKEKPTTTTTTTGGVFCVWLFNNTFLP